MGGCLFRAVWLNLWGGYCFGLGVLMIWVLILLPLSELLLSRVLSLLSQRGGPRHCKARKVACIVDDNVFFPSMFPLSAAQKPTTIFHETKRAPTPTCACDIVRLSFVEGYACGLELSGTNEITINSKPQASSGKFVL